MGNIHKNIRERRLQLKLTQEQVAQRLGISTPAVNKWEKGVSCPDIGLLPALARLLKTDVNTLLSFEEELTLQEIAEFINQLAAQGMQPKAKKAFEMAEEKICQYPNCHMLLLNTAMLLEGVFAMSKDKDISGYSADIEAWYIRAAQSEDMQIQNQANARLVARYMSRHEYAKAQALLDSIPPEPSFNKRQLQASLYIKQDMWKEAAKLTESGIIADISRLQTALLTLINVAQKENRERDAAYITDVAVRLAQLLDQSEFTIQSLRFQQAMLNKDAELLMEALQALLPGLLNPQKNKLSPLYRHLPEKEMDIRFGKIMLPRILKDLEDEQSHDLDFVKGNSEFQALIAEYKSKLS